MLEADVSSDDLNVVRYNELGVGMLKDNLFTTEDMASNNKGLVPRSDAHAE